MDPVIAMDGHSYERTAIEQWFQAGRLTSPVTNERLASSSLMPNYALRSAIEAFREKSAKSAKSATSGSQATPPTSATPGGSRGGNAAARGRKAIATGVGGVRKAIGKPPARVKGEKVKKEEAGACRRESRAVNRKARPVLMVPQRATRSGQGF